MKPWLMFLLWACVTPAQDRLHSIQGHVARTPRLERGYLDRTSRLLDQERSRLAARDFTRAWMLAGLYQRIGAAYARDGYYPGALQNYHGALLVLNQIATSNPDDPRVRGDLLTVVGSVRALGGTVPVWADIPIGGAPASDGAFPMASPEREAGTEFPLPALDNTALSDGRKSACDRVISRYVQTAAAAQAALSVLADLRASVQSHGLALRAAYVSAESRIKLGIETARRIIEDKRCESAGEPLSIAAEEVRRLLRELGQ